MRTKPIMPGTIIPIRKKLVEGNSEPEIEKNVPMPIRTSETFKYDFVKMEVGDSYFREGQPRRARAALRSALAFAKRQFPELKERKFRTAERTQKVDNETGARIWRRL